MAKLKKPKAKGKRLENLISEIIKNEWNLKFTGTENRFIIYKYPFKQDDIYEIK